MVWLEGSIYFYLFDARPTTFLLFDARPTTFPIVLAPKSNLFLHPADEKPLEEVIKSLLRKKYCKNNESAVH